jgi:uncharacterized protein (DUF305 family)
MPSTHIIDRRSTLTTKLSALVAVLATLLALTGCGDDEEPTNKTRTAANGDEFNDADVAFATDMIPHHAQALAMVDLTLDRQLDPEVQQFADDIRDAQAPEIEQMTDWLTAWDEPIPETVRDHANAHGEGGMEMDSDMPGMMSEEEMSELENADDAEFQDMFLEMMIEHHEGAIEMAQTEQEEGMFKPAIELAKSIETSQKEEITLMEDLLAS